jgi:hypothetical protein
VKVATLHRSDFVQQNAANTKTNIYDSLLKLHWNPQWMTTKAIENLHTKDSLFPLFIYLLRIDCVMSSFFKLSN